MSAVMPRMMELSTPLGKDLLFRWLRGKEELGRPSEFELAALSTRNDIKPSDLLGKKIGVVACSECDDRQPGRVRVHDRQRALANRTGRAENRKSSHERFRTNK